MRKLPAGMRTISGQAAHSRKVSAAFGACSCAAESGTCAAAGTGTTIASENAKRGCAS